MPFNQTMSTIAVIALEDGDWDGPTYNFTIYNTDVVLVDYETYYAAQQLPAITMHPLDESTLARPSTGTAMGDVL